MNGEDFKRLEQLIFNFKEEVKTEFRHQIGIQSENFQHKLDIVVEGHQMLAEKLDRVETRLDTRMDCLEHKLDHVAAELGEVKAKGNYTAAKLDDVAADLKAHRADTEVHKKVYKVKED